MHQLADRLREIIASSPPDARGRRAYVEVGDDHPEHETLYAGVRVRRLTHYGDEDLDRMAEAFDRAYDEVMLGRMPRPIAVMPDGTVQAHPGEA